MAKVCIGCGRREKIHDYNYAGFKVLDSSDHAFKSRIIAPLIPGPKTKIFLCDTCVNKSYQIKCKVHGIIKDGKYNWGKPPICKKCKEQLKKLNLGELPVGFKGLIRLSSLVLQPDNKVTKPFIGISNDNELHIIAGEVFYSGKADDFFLSIFQKSNFPVLKLSPKGRSRVDSCYISIEDLKILEKGIGPWFDIWKPALQNKFKLKDSLGPISISSMEVSKIIKNEFKKDTVRYSVLFTINSKGILTYPETDIPSLDQLVSWSFSNTLKADGLHLLFEINRLPISIKIRELLRPDGFSKLTEISKLLPQEKKIDEKDIISLSNKGIFKLVFYPNGKEEETLLEKKNNLIYATLLSTGESYKFNLGLNYKNRFIFISNERNTYAIGSFQNSVINLLSNSVKEIEDLISDNSCKWGLYFEKQNSQAIRTLQLFKDKITIDPEKDISYSSIKRLNIRDLGSNNCEILIAYEMDEPQIYEDIFIAPEKYAYKSLEQLEMRKAEYLTNSRTTNQLYKQYNKLKKHNLLVGMFLDIIMLSRELDSEISMEELSSKITGLSTEKFYENKKLSEMTTRKLLLLSIFLPKIKQNYEYLSSFYPYYQVKNEMKLISNVFGVGVADKLQTEERRRITSSSRQNIRNIQANLQRILSEIEMAVHPIDRIIAKDDLKKSLSSKVLRSFPHAGQAILIGTMVATGAATGGVGIIAGMLGIRAINDVMTYFQKDKETASQIKKAAESVFSWWQVLKDTLPVTIFEAGDKINEENDACIRRDNDIFNQFPKEKQKEIADKLDAELKRKVSEGIKNTFVEVLDGSGIRFRTISHDIDSAIKIEMAENLEKVLGTITIPDKNKLLEE